MRILTQNAYISYIVIYHEDAQPLNISFMDVGENTIPINGVSMDVVACSNTQSSGEFILHGIYQHIVYCKTN